MNRRGDRARSPGGAAGTGGAFRTCWHYDVPRGLESRRRAGAPPNERVAPAIAPVVSKRDGAGRGPLETGYPGVMPVAIHDGQRRPRRWITRRGLRVLNG